MRSRTSEHSTGFCMMQDINPFHEAVDNSKISFRVVKGIKDEFDETEDWYKSKSAKEPFVSASRFLQRIYKLDDAEVSGYAQAIHASLALRSVGDPKYMAPQNSLLRTVQSMIRDGVNSMLFATAFIEAACIQDRINKGRERGRAGMMELLSGTHPVCQLGMPGESDLSGIGKNHRFLFDNQRDNFLHVIGGPGDEYDELHRKGMYIFTEAEEPTNFCSEVVKDARLIQGKDVLEIGTGNGADAQHYLEMGARSVEIVEGSAYMMGKLMERKSHLPPELKDRFMANSSPNTGDCASDMFDALSNMRERNIQFDTIVSNSCFHYFDDVKLQELLCLLHECLRPAGHLAFAVKAPGAPLDGNGILLTDNLNGRRYMEKHPRGRMWLNLDGQVRKFRDMDRWDDLLSKKFRVVRKSQSVVENYETPTQGPQKFYEFICRTMLPPSTLLDAFKSGVPQGIQAGGLPQSGNMISSSLPGSHPGVVKNSLKERGDH